MPHFIGHGSHDLNAKRHRFIVVPRFGKEVSSIFLDNGRKMPLHTVYRLAIQMVSGFYFHCPQFLDETQIDLFGFVVSFVSSMSMNTFMNANMFMLI